MESLPTKSDTTSSKVIESLSQVKTDQKEEVKPELDVDEEVDSQEQAIEHEILEKHIQNDIVKSKLKIKFIIGEIVHSDHQLQVRKFFSPLTNAFGLGGQIGLFHSAIILGPWYLEWNNSSICIPRRCYSSAALLAIDLKENVISEINVDDAIDKVSKMICRWNAEKSYDRLTCNCQHFIDDLLKTLGITLKFQKTMGDFVKKIRNAGECKIEWKIPKDVMEKHLLKEQVVSFDTHSALDDFVSKLFEKEPLFNEKYPEDYLLLKSFDRAFWLRSYKDKKSPKHQCIKDGQGDCACPFYDPEKTKSLVTSWW